MCFLISFQQQLSGAAERTDCVQQEKLPDKKSFEREEEKRCRVTVTKSLKLQSPPASPPRPPLAGFLPLADRQQPREHVGSRGFCREQLLR